MYTTPVVAEKHLESMLTASNVWSNISIPYYAIPYVMVNLTYPEHRQGGVFQKPEISRTKKPYICQGKKGANLPTPGPTTVPLPRLRINPSVAPEALAGATGRPLTSCSLIEASKTEMTSWKMDHHFHESRYFPLNMVDFPLKMVEFPLKIGISRWTWGFFQVVIR